MAKKVSQSEMRQMMQKLKAEKSDSGGDRKRKYKLSSKELALMELEKKRKVEDKLQQKKTTAQKAGVPDNFFDSAKTKAFLNLGKAPQKSILKKSGGGGQAGILTTMTHDHQLQCSTHDQQLQCSLPDQCLHQTVH